jgi:hypothetical protein
MNVLKLEGHYKEEPRDAYKIVQDVLKPSFEILPCRSE